MGLLGLRDICPKRSGSWNQLLPDQRTKIKLMSLAELERVKFLEKIEVAIYAHNPSPLSEDYNWIVARKRVNDILGVIGASLPE